MIWVFWGSKKLRQIYGKPFSKLKAFCISFFIWLTHAILFFLITYIGTEKTGYASPKITAILLIWWAYSNLREQYLKNCFYATGTPNERDYFANILDITLTMNRDEVIKKYVSQKKTALTPEEQQKVELAYTFFIEPKKYEKLVKDKSKTDDDTLNTIIQDSSSTIMAKVVEDSSNQFISTEQSSDVPLFPKEGNEINSKNKEKNTSSNEKITLISKTYNTQNSNKVTIISVTSIIIILIGISFWVGYDEARNKKQNTNTVKNSESLEDIILIAEKHIESRYTTPLAKKMISEKLEKIISDQQLTELQKIERIKKDIIKDNNSTKQNSVSEYINKYKNNPISNDDEAILLCNKGKKLWEEKDHDQAFVCFKKAAEMGNARAQAHLGKCYFYGILITELKEKDSDELTKEAIKWYKKSAEQGDALGERLLSPFYLYGSGGEKKDVKYAFDLLQHSADQGDIDAIRSLGDYYYDGICTPQDYEKAFECYQKAAIMGNSSALCDLGECYLNGKGIMKNESEAFRLFKLAVEKGEAGGYYHLGKCYYFGYSTPVNYSEAFRCFKISSDMYFFPAWDWIGLCYANGQGVEQDSKIAFTWYMKAAEKGDDGGEFHVGLSYYIGQGVEKDEQEGIKWLKRAAKHGERNAQRMLFRLNINYE